jgi:hypothetical protein
MGIPRSAYRQLLDKQYSIKVRKRNQPEAGIVLSILKYLNARGHYCGKIKTKGAPAPNGGFIKDWYQMRGLPDIFSFSPDGVLYAIEAKAGKNEQTIFQKDFQKYFHKPPHRIYLVAYSLDDIITVIK